MMLEYYPEQTQKYYLRKLLLAGSDRKRNYLIDIEVMAIGWPCGWIHLVPLAILSFLSEKRLKDYTHHLELCKHFTDHVTYF